jgi:hypothetical protein
MTEPQQTPGEMHRTTTQVSAVTKSSINEDLVRRNGAEEKPQAGRLANKALSWLSEEDLPHTRPQLEPRCTDQPTT